MIAGKNTPSTLSETLAISLTLPKTSPLSRFHALGNGFLN